MEKTRFDPEWYTGITRIHIPCHMDKDYPDCVFQFLKCIIGVSIRRLELADPVTGIALDFVFRSIDYYMDFIRFSLHNKNNCATINLKSLHDGHEKIKLLENRFRDFGSFSEENEAQSRRIEGCFRDLFSALEERGQRRHEEPTSAQTGEASSVPCEPFFKSPDLFPSEAARVFMTTLRRINIKVRTVAPSVTLQELSDLFSATNISQLDLSETMTDTALRAINYILEEVLKKVVIQNASTLADDLDLNRCLSLIDSFKALNGPEVLQERRNIYNTHDSYIHYRLELTKQIMRCIRSKLPPPALRPVLEPVPEDFPSPLWLKLRAAGSVGALTEGKEEDKCSVCLQENVTWKNFSLLDKCAHLSCVQCIETWFEKSSTCPFCRTRISRWTTRDHFVAALERSTSPKDNFSLDLQLSNAVRIE